MSSQEQLIGQIIGQLKGEGAQDIQTKVDLESEYTMRMIGGHVPDITATIGNGLHLYVVVTSDALEDERAAERWRAFADYAQRGAATLHIAIPKGEQELLDGVPADVKEAAEVVEL